MKRSSIALFLSTLALAGGTVACGAKPEAGEQGGDQDRQEKLNRPEQAKPANGGSDEGGEGGEGGEG